MTLVALVMGSDASKVEVGAGMGWMNLFKCLLKSFEFVYNYFFNRFFRKLKIEMETCIFFS